ncbi:MAG: rod shape-determining protein [Lachnospiraceae bacterium]|nr:rod shape-determining protein [Lachnospiraceae bacterium]MDD3615864.1 rod shape-determining protein [Lachnospiraceae bacterium]
MLTKNIFGIDLGTSTVKVFSYRKKRMITEKNMVAVRNKQDVLAVGNEAYEMYEKTPDNIDVRSTMSYGMIADIDRTEFLLNELLYRADKHMGSHSILYFAVPVDMTEIERRAYYYITMAGQLKKSRVYLVERPIADAIAMGIDIDSKVGSLVVNIGAQSSEISIITEGKVIVSKIVHVGGDDLNHSIRDIIRRKKNILIGERTAQRLKYALASFEDNKKDARKIVGLNSLSGLPRETICSSALVREAITESVNQIGEEIKFFIERTPPQIVKSVLQDGIYLAGGSTRIPYIGEYLQDYLGCPVKISQYYDMCTIKGLETIISDKNLREEAVSLKEKTHY